MAGRYMTAAEAARRLGIQPATLYAYVSRGLIRSEEAGGSKRSRRYSAEDIERLSKRQEQRRDPAKAAEDALYWGTPVLESALTLIDNGQLYYRGYNAIELATRHSLEEVAALLWTGDLQSSVNSIMRQEQEYDASKYLAFVDRTELRPVERFQMALVLAGNEDASAFDLRPPAIMEKGARILCLLTLIAAQRRTMQDGIAEALQSSWAAGNKSASTLLNAALILCADHELNISAFTARCVASAGSSLYAVVNAGLSALQGTKHGGYTRRVEALFEEIKSGKNVRRVLAERLARGETIPGFGHHLYPDGDPRSRALLELITHAFPRNRTVALAYTIARETQELIGEQPTIDFALVLLARVLGIREDGAMTLFALGRTAGWIAHALEQYELNQLIRPRARYVGPMPL